MLQAFQHGAGVIRGTVVNDDDLVCQPSGTHPADKLPKGGFFFIDGNDN
jgi:hypothetical protein